MTADFAGKSTLSTPLVRLEPLPVWMLRSRPATPMDYLTNVTACNCAANCGSPPSILRSILP
jgi:hypothetical protein